MMKRFFLVLSILIIGFVNASYAFNFNEQKTFKEGKKHFEKERYNLALPHFLALQRSYPDNANFNYCVGMCYYHASSMYDSTIYYLSRATEKKNVTLYYKNSYKSEQAPAKAYYYLGLAYFKNNMPETAIRHLKHYQKFLDRENKNQGLAYDDVNLQIKVCDNEKDYAFKQRQLKTGTRDSLNNEIAFYKVNYEGSARLLEMKTNEVNQLLQELETYNKSKNRPIGTPETEIPDKSTSFTIQVMASEKDLPTNYFSRLTDVKKCRMADGLYHYLYGEFATREDAEEKCKEVRGLGYPDAWIRPSLSCK
ncbi:MAG: SPOR domain-containing protein [Bacteroidales bacterium]|nr:SPOR domain-containing protein [Bacteroidales bacterium]